MAGLKQSDPHLARSLKVRVAVAGANYFPDGGQILALVQGGVYPKAVDEQGNLRVFLLPKYPGASGRCIRQ